MTSASHVNAVSGPAVIRPGVASAHDAKPVTKPAVRGLLFTGFEPSGDDHASAVIAELRRRHPDPAELPIYAWGGPKMERAGAVIVERTGDSAVMGMPGLGKLLEHHRLNRRVRAWLKSGPLAAPRGTSSSSASERVLVHVPVDSPAANFPICKMSRAAGYKVVHMVAPQVWAWASWRINKLKRLTNQVLCLLPFEEEWFMARGVPARFVGHPLFDHPVNLNDIQPRIDRLRENDGVGFPRLALMPGSRPTEMTRCFPVLLDAYRRVQKDFPETRGVVAATKPETAQKLREIASNLGGWPPGLQVVAGDTDGAVGWCDFALVVSGTVTLQIARQLKPMVAIYRPSKVVYYCIGKWLISTRLFTLPNLVAGREIIKELIPHFGDGEELAIEIIKLMRRDGYADEQRESLAAVVRRFAGKDAAVESADAIERMLGYEVSSRQPG